MIKFLFLCFRPQTGLGAREGRTPSIPVIESFKRENFNSHLSNHHDETTISKRQQISNQKKNREIDLLNKSRHGLK